MNAPVMAASHYQSFDFLGGPRRDSDSAGKWALSRLGSPDFNGAAVLDVGCNAGYFCFRLLDQGAARIVGIDTGAPFIAAARWIQETYRPSERLEFIHGDFFDHPWTERFDWILCLSTFHYFGGRQGEFFDRARALQHAGGTLLLEAEEHPVNDGPQVRLEVRPADRKPYPYPNEAQIRAWAEGSYTVFDRYLSVKQGGTLYDRWFTRFAAR